MRLFPSFLFDGLRKVNWNGGHGNGCVSERCGGYLVTTAADTARAHFDSFCNDPADGKRDVPDFNPGDDAEAGVENQAEDCASESESQAAYEKSVRILWDLALQLIHTMRARERAVDTKILARYALVARLAYVRAGFWCVFRRAKLGSGIAEI